MAHAAAATDLVSLLPTPFLTAQGVRPSARSFHQMAYDNESDRIILFGGTSTNDVGALALNDTWAYDSKNNTWMKMSPLVAPSPRAGFGMAYDSKSDRVVVFGGINIGTANNETWAYDFNSNTWTNLKPPGSPTPRFETDMVYDAESDRLILFGGLTSGFVLLRQTWAYDLNTNTWVNMNPTPSPSAAANANPVYDAGSDRMIHFGGITRYTELGETWAYDLNANQWTNLTPSSAPSPRSVTAMAYDAASDRVVLFGGSVGSDETWAFDFHANTWAKLNIASAPSGRMAQMAYDRQSDRIVLFGGFSPVDGRMNRETWVFSWGTGTWTMVDGPEPPVATFSISPTSPVAGDTLAMDASASSDPDGRIVVFAWDFGDGGKAFGASVTHPFAAAGTYTVTLNVTDDDGLKDTATQQVVVIPAPDTLDPFVAITFPSNGARLNATVVSVTGTASDNVEIAKVELSLDGVNRVLATGTTNWSGTLTLVEGPNTISARAMDTSGNEATTTREVVVDTTAPSAGIGSVSLTDCAARTWTVTGTASDNLAVQKVELSTDQTNWVLADGTTAWSATLTIAEISPTIYVRATDTAGNMAGGNLVHVDEPARVACLPLSLFVLGIVGGAAAAGVGIIVAIRLRRRRKD